ncbi:hypothetical protein, partial [Caldanaerobacter sp.]|uniref:hypothetical protein n=1 Tax=Caldanaerobacter sp. TaxID=2930036 RepID=UPI003C775529
LAPPSLLKLAKFSYRFGNKSHLHTKCHFLDFVNSLRVLLRENFFLFTSSVDVKINKRRGEE